MDISEQVRLSKKSKLLANNSLDMFEEILTIPKETSFCGERLNFETCVSYPWEVYELQNRKLI